jgi:DNA-directed RNA polymerase subunit H
MAFKVSDHNLVPKHTLLKDKEKQKILEKFHVSEVDLPKILITDPSIVDLNTKVGDVVKITRESRTAGVSIYYRAVING